MKDKINIYVSRTLSIGIFLAIVFFISGLAVAIFFEKNFDVMNFSYDIKDIFPDLFALKSRVFFELGTICIIITPFARTIAAGFFFLKNKDIRYFIISFFVFSFLLLSIFLSLFFALKLE